MSQFDIKTEGLSEERKAEKFQEHNLQLIRKIFEQIPGTYLFGGYAAEVHLHEGEVLDDHHDVDVGILRSQAEAAELGFQRLGFRVKAQHDTRSEEVLKFNANRGDLHCDIALVNWDDSREQPYFQVTKSGSAVRVYFDKDIFSSTGRTLDGVPVRVVSPLCLIQCFRFYTDMGWGDQREKDRIREKALKAKFFPDKDPDDPMFDVEIIPVTKNQV